MKNIGVILAGGIGNRFKKKLPKQFLKLKDKAIICYSIEAFEKNNSINEILLVIPREFIDYAKKLISKYTYTKVKDIICGGDTRPQSSYRAISHIAQNNPNCKLLIHDAARPFVTVKLINDIIKNLNIFDAVCPYVPATDTIYMLNQNNNIEDIPDRKSLGYVQTPQGFKLQIIKTAFDKGLQNLDFQPTDDCSIVKKYLPRASIKMIPGDINNIKITYSKDIQNFNA